jgi:hypothetical protein
MQLTGEPSSILLPTRSHSTVPHIDSREKNYILQQSPDVWIAHVPLTSSMVHSQRLLAEHEGISDHSSGFSGSASAWSALSSILSPDYFGFQRKLEYGSRLIL